MKILICGHRSYAARNFKEKLENAGHEVWCFSRGNVMVDNHVITGPVMEMDKNPYLKGISVEVVINFILLDGQSVDDNLKYIDALCKWCKQTGVKRLVHMSSISVLSNSVCQVDEDTPIDSYPELKGKYGALKVAVDNKLLHWGKLSGIQVVLARPGFITAQDKKNALAGIAKMLPGGLAILMGNRKSTLPVIDRDELQRGLQNAIEAENPLKVYLMVEAGDHTKIEYLRTLAPKVKVIALPKGIVIFVAHLLKVIGVFDDRKVQMVAGLFKVQHFNAERTFCKINN